MSLPASRPDPDSPARLSEREWTCNWPAGPRRPRLLPGQVHVWAARLDLSAAQLVRLHSYLDEEEIDRAGRLRFESDRQRFVARHGLLRLLLGQYLDVEPQRLRFQANPYNKPALSAEYTTGSPHLPPSSPVQFNLSHSVGAALFAITAGQQVGVDIEYMRPDLNFTSLAERFFSPAEQAAFRAYHSPKYSPDLRQQAFYNGWSRKEAYIKAVGLGLSLPLDQFDVSLAPDKPAGPNSAYPGGRASLLLATRYGADRSENWDLRRLDPLPGYAAAVCIERIPALFGQDLDICCWQLPDYLVA